MKAARRARGGADASAVTHLLSRPEGCLGTTCSTFALLAFTEGAGRKLHQTPRCIALYASKRTSEALCLLLRHPTQGNAQLPRKKIGTHCFWIWCGCRV